MQTTRVIVVIVSTQTGDTAVSPCKWEEVGLHTLFGVVHNLQCNGKYIGTGKAHWDYRVVLYTEVHL